MFFTLQKFRKILIIYMATYFVGGILASSFDCFAFFVVYVVSRV